MTPYEILRLVVWAIGGPIIVLLCVRAFRQARAIRALHEKLRADEAANPQNPYASLANLYGEKDATKARKRERL